MSQPNFESASDFASDLGGDLGTDAAADMGVGAAAQDSVLAPSVLRRQPTWNPYLALLAISAGALLLAVVLLFLEFWIQYQGDAHGPLA